MDATDNKSTKSLIILLFMYLIGIGAWIII
jgi:hypothetical protein